MDCKTWHVPTVLLTGATSGVGFQTAKSLSQAGYNLILPVRDLKIGQQLRHEFGQVKVDFVECDLADMSSVAAAGCDIRVLVSGGTALKAIIFNAGIYPGAQLRTTADRIEETLAVNVLSQFLLYRELEWVMSTNTRIITLGSEAHRLKSGWLGKKGPEITDPATLFEPNPQGKLNRFEKNPQARYATSKLFCIQLAYQIQRRGRARGITGFAVDPGMVTGTRIFRNYPVAIRSAYQVAAPVIKGSATKMSALSAGKDLAWVAVDKGAEALAGKYISHRQAVASSPESYNLELSDAVWRACMRLTENHVSAQTRGRQRNR